MKPWVHYIPVPKDASQATLEYVLLFLFYYYFFRALLFVR